MSAEDTSVSVSLTTVVKESTDSSLTKHELLRDEDLTTALAILEEFVELSNSLNELSSRLPNDYKAEGLSLASKLESLVNILDSDQISIPVVKKARMSGYSRKCVIDRLGIGSELLRQREQGQTMTSIAHKYSLSPRTVIRWFEYFDSLKPTQKSAYVGKSVFDTVQRLEELSAMLLQQIARLQGSQDDIAVKYVSEYKDTLRLALTFSEKLLKIKAYQEFKEKVSNILLKYVPPEARQLALREIADAGAIHSLASSTTSF